MPLLSHHLQQHVVLLRLRDHSCVSYRDVSLNCENVAKRRTIMNLVSNGSHHDPSTKLISFFLFFAGMKWMDSPGRFISIAARCLGNSDSISLSPSATQSTHLDVVRTCQQASGKGFPLILQKQPPPMLPFHVCRDNISGPLTHRTCGISIALRREGDGETNHIFPYFSVIIQSHVAAADIDSGVVWFRVTKGRTRPSSRLSAQSNFLPDVISFCSSPSLLPS